MAMQSLKIDLSKEEYGEFKDLLYTCVNSGIPILNDNIAVLVLKQIEDEE
jgi:hypothetical protein